MNKKERENRFLGCLVGLAIGDALGMPLEWAKPGFTPVTDMIVGTTHKMPAGCWTDDTSMALCLAESLITKKDFDPSDQLNNYYKWWKVGYLSSTGKPGAGIGRSTRNALTNYEKTGQEYCGIKDGKSFGNGSIMRLAPIPMFYYKSKKETLKYSSLSSKTTHGNPRCIIACNVLGEAIRKALNGKSKKEILTFKPTKSKIINNIIINKSYIDEPPYIKGTGYVVKSLEAALWAFNKSKSFEHGVLLAVNLGEDADTTGAIFGQLAGAYYGYDSIPLKWRKKLFAEKEISSFALKLLDGKKK